MLIYHQRNDVFHCSFRILSVLSILNEHAIEYEKLKIIDFYLVFPHLINEIRLPRMVGATEIKKQAKEIHMPYEKLPGKRMLFSEMGDFQSQAIDILTSKELCDITKSNIISRGRNFDLEEIKALTESNIITSSSFYRKFITLISSIDLLGDSGLKSRTGLMEYRYDAV